MNWKKSVNKGLPTNASRGCTWYNSNDRWRYLSATDLSSIEIGVTGDRAAKKQISPFLPHGGLPHGGTSESAEKAPAKRISILLDHRSVSVSYSMAKSRLSKQAMKSSCTPTFPLLGK